MKPTTRALRAGPRPGRRGWGLVFVLLILAICFTAIFAVSRRAVDTYRGGKSARDRQAMRDAIDWSLATVVSDPARWLQEGAAARVESGDFAVAIRSNGPPPERLRLPRGPMTEYRELAASVQAHSRQDARELGAEPDERPGAAAPPLESARLERRYAAAWEPSQPVRLILLEERWLAPDPPDPPE